MTNNEILKADVLDILFDNRNKLYGAYQLRKTYSRRLSMALIITALLTLGLFGFRKLQGYETQQELFKEPEPIILTELELPKPPDKPRPVALPQPTPPIQHIATSQYTSKIEIVQNLKIDDNLMPPVDELENKAIGKENIDGPALTGAQQPANLGPTENTQTVAAPEEPEFYEAAAVEQMAEFPGGAGAFQRYLARYLPQPASLEEGEVKTVKVRFVIEKDGSIGRVTIVQSGGAELDQAVTRVIQRAPRWIPALYKGHNVAVVFTQPVTFMGQ